MLNQPDYDLHGGPPVSITAPHLAITHGRPHGYTYSLHVVEDHDLGVGKGAAADLLRSAEGGQLVLAFSLDGEDADELRYFGRGGTGPLEVLLQAREAVALAIEAMQKVDKL